jgi:CubicO group peptidase (beta-lactamase class C family)
VLAAAGLAALATAGEALAQGGPPPVVREAVDAVVRWVENGDEDARRDLEGRLTDSLRASFPSEAALTAYLDGLVAAVDGPVDEIRVERDPDGLVLRLEGRASVRIRMGLDEASGRITRLELSAASEPVRDGPLPAARAVDGHVETLMALARDEGAAERLLASAMTPALAASRSEAAWASMLDRIGRLAASAGSVEITRDEDGFLLTLQGAGTARIRMRVEDEPPHRLTTLALDTTTDARPGAAIAPLTWSTLDERLREAESEGFSGVVLAVRDGEVVLDRGYGLANRERGIPNSTGTVFDVGSIPIDFTRAAVLLLVQEGRLALDDPIARFLPDVPDDKRGITVRHLLDGRSGLHNFHHLPGDDDPDLDWIERETAERRILAQRLLFAPGAESAPSHSAFGLLAAIVERVSGDTYEDFLASRFLRPAGMTRTGPYGDDLGLSVDDFAVGYGASSVGDPNVPPRWGPTSWLIKGSGGMVSTPADMRRWFEHLRSGRILHGEALDLYLDRGSAAGATDRGFLFVHAWAGGESMVFLASNAGASGPGGDGLARALVDLVRTGPATR